MKDYRELESQMIDWAKDKGIFEKGTPLKQSYKTIEEVAELISAVSINDKAEIKDALGDIIVTIIIQAKMQDLDLMGHGIVLVFQEL